jgi:site-specific recombinase XerC
MPDTFPAVLVPMSGIPDAPGAVIQAGEEGLAQAVSRVFASWMRRLGDGSPRTAQSYGREARAFLVFMQGARSGTINSLIKATPADCSAFVHAVPGLSASSQAVKAAVLRSLFGAMVLECLIATNPAAEVRVRHVASGKHHKAIPQGSIITVLEKLEASERLQDIRDRALLLVALAIGARRFEIAALNIGSIERSDDAKASISFVGKGKKTVCMTIRPAVLKAIDRWLAAVGKAGDTTAPLFHCLSRRPEHHGKRLTGGGIRHIIKSHFKRYSPHGLRARAITDVWQKSNGNLHYAQTFARHSSPAVTETVYVQGEKLERALEYVFDYG